MEILWMAAVVAAVISGFFAFVNSANVERLKYKFDRERQELVSSFQEKLEGIKLESERMKSTHVMHIKNEYEIYESIYPKLVKAYYATIDTIGVDDEPDIVLEAAMDESEIQESRRLRLERAAQGREHLFQVEERKPFIHGDVYREIAAFNRMCLHTQMVRTHPVLKISLSGTNVWREYSKDELELQLESICRAIKTRLKVVDS